MSLCDLEPKKKTRQSSQSRSAMRRRLQRRNRRIGELESENDNLRQTSRFMNLGSLFTWSMMVLYHLNTPGSNSRIGISHERMEQKLGWLREYADDLVRWNQCQEVIDRSLSVINRQGLHSRTAELVEQSLREQHPDWRNEDSSSTRIGVQLLDWIQKSSSQLKAGEPGYRRRSSNRCSVASNRWNVSIAKAALRA